VFQRLVSHNDDIRRLVDKGYALAFDSNHLIVRDVPYLDATGGLNVGAIVSKLEFIDPNRVKQVDHQVFFAGGHPHGLDASPIPLGGGPATLALTDACKDIVVQRSFSNKRKVNGKLVSYVDLFEKIETYVTIISGPAMERYQQATPYTYRAVETSNDTSVFKLNDTLTSRAEITELSAKFSNDVVAIIGLGGTGAYVLDFLAKTPVREIRGFDGDAFHIHNSFRSPGRLELAELGKSKAEVYAGRYNSFRHGVTLETKYIDADSIAEMDGVTFAFVCVDKGSARARIFDLLIARRIPFIDVGMGLNRKHGAINGMCRVTYYSPESAQVMRAKKLAEEADQDEDIYDTRIQIGELNALNASLAVIKFKQLRAFYLGEASMAHLLFELKDLKIVGE
jgi:molybdopterin/thiamine biosynthesis adenylyltransferase